MQMNRKRITEEKSPLKLYRKATTQDVDKWKNAKERESETMHKARTIALELGLAMKLSDVEYQGDKSKATFYYTAEGRVDFRELIKKLAESFKVRIEMRQIGMRQEASRLGGIGSCGRELCCSTWLTDFKTVSTSAARYQNLSLNTLKLAGQCGKLKCCLNYELDSYLDALKEFPQLDNKRLATEKGYAFHQKTDIFKRIIWWSYTSEPDVFIPLSIARTKEILQLNAEEKKPADLLEAKHFKDLAEAKIPDYENVVGQDSLTRFDDRKKTNHNRNKNNNFKKPNSNTDTKNNTTKNTQHNKPNHPKHQANKQNSNQEAKPIQKTGQQSINPKPQHQHKKPVHNHKPKPKNDNPPIV
jgi:cell fate regulator YaaT (PSP1 superfamily)